VPLYFCLNHDFSQRIAPTTRIFQHRDTEFTEVIYPYPKGSLTEVICEQKKNHKNHKNQSSDIFSHGLHEFSRIKNSVKLGVSSVVLCVTKNLYKTITQSCTELHREDTETHRGKSDKSQKSNKSAVQTKTDKKSVPLHFGLKNRLYDDKAF